MEDLKRRAINFDLDTKKMKASNLYPQGYYQIRQSMKEEGFEHRQGSGYVSADETTMAEVHTKVRRLVKKLPWLVNCVNKLDVTEVGKNFDMTSVIRGLVFGAAAVRQETIQETATVAADEYEMEE